LTFDLLCGNVSSQREIYILKGEIKMRKNKKNYYEIIGLEADASVDEIKKRISIMLQNLKNKKNRGEINQARFDEGYNYLAEIWNTLRDEEKRNAYDTSLRNSNHEPKNSKIKSLFQNKRKIVKYAVIGIAAIAGTVLTLNLFGSVGKKLANKTGAKEGKGIYMDDPSYNPNVGYDINNSYGYSNQQPTDNYQSDSYTDAMETKDAEIEALKKEINDLKGNQQQKSVNNTTSNIPELVNYGDINDSALLEERATKMVNQLNAAGLYNIGTYAPYTVDEMKEIIRYVNGVYVPEDEVDALSKVDDFLNLLLSPLNNETFINIVNYQGGEDSFKKDVEAKAKNPNKVEFVKNMLFGNSNVGPYLQWLENQYYKMQMTTDRERSNKIYNNVMKSLAEFSFGDGFELNGKVYKEGMALGLDKVNSGNVLQALVSMIQPLRTANAKNYYTITDSHISANPDKNKVHIPYLQITEWYTPLCDEKYYEFDENGYLLVDQKAASEVGIKADPQSSENFASINQMNTANALLEQLYGKDKDYSKILTK